MSSLWDSCLLFCFWFVSFPEYLIAWALTFVEKLMLCGNVKRKPNTNGKPTKSNVKHLIAGSIQKYSEPLGWCCRSRSAIESFVQLISQFTVRTTSQCLRCSCTRFHYVELVRIVVFAYKAPGMVGARAPLPKASTNQTCPVLRWSHSWAERQKGQEPWGQEKQNKERVSLISIHNTTASQPCSSLWLNDEVPSLSVAALLLPPSIRYKARIVCALPILIRKLLRCHLICYLLGNRVALGNYLKKCLFCLFVHSMFKFDHGASMVRAYSFVCSRSWHGKI